LLSIENLDDKELRNASEKDVFALFALLACEFPDEDSFVDRIAQCETHFCLRLPRSKYLGKRFASLQYLKTKDSLPESLGDEFSRTDLFSNLLQGARKESIPGLVWLLRKLVLGNWGRLEDLTAFWIFVVNDCPSALESCFELIEGLPDDYQQHFWQQFSETPVFPLQFFQVLQFVYQNLNTQAHSIVFDTLMRMGQDENLSEEHRSAIVATVHFYFPDDPEVVLETEQRAMSMFKSGINLSFALALLNVSFNFLSPPRVREVFREVLDTTTNFLEYTSQYLDLCYSSLRKFEEPINESELSRFEALLQPLLFAKPAQVKNFFAQISCAVRPIFPGDFFVHILGVLCQADSPDDEIVPFMIVLFKEANRVQFSRYWGNEGLWNNGVHQLLAVDDLWSHLHRTSSVEIATFLAKLYSQSSCPSALDEFLEHCLRSIDGCLIALQTLVDIRERIAVRSPEFENRWKPKSDSIEVQVDGSWSGTVKLPVVVTHSLIADLFSDFFVLSREQFSVTVDGARLLAQTELTKTSKITLVLYRSQRLSPPPLPFDQFTEQHKQFLVSLLDISDLSLANRALEIVNRLPTLSSELEKLKTVKIDWAEMLDVSFPLLVYKLHAIGHLIETDWVHRFVKSGGVRFVLSKLVLDAQLYKRDPVVLRLFSTILTVDNSFLADINTVQLNQLVELLLLELKESETNSIPFMVLVVQIVTSSPDFLAQIDSIKSLLQITSFHECEQLRTMAVTLLGTFETNSLLVDLLPSADCPHSSEYFTLFASRLKNPEDGFFEQCADLFVSKFAEATSNVLAQPPFAAWVSGMISLLLQISQARPSIPTSMPLLTCLLDCIAFSRFHYFSLTPDFFDLVVILMATSPEAQELTYSKLEEKHRQFSPSASPHFTNFAPFQRFRGLLNLGATCYANSALQALFRVREFRDAVLASEAHDSDSWFFRFQLLFAKLLLFPAQAIDTRFFFEKWTNSDGPRTNVRDQQDSFEFMQLLLDRTGDINSDALSVFSGQLRHTTLGVSVDYTSETQEPFTTLSLDISEQNTVTESFEQFLLPDCHKDYNAEDLGKIDVQRFHSIHTPPKVLILQLKRFE
jgi:hypothetical protein